MKKVIVAAMLASTLALGGCAQEMAKLQAAYNIATTAAVPASTAQVMVSSFEVLEAGATEYFIYCKKSPTDSICAAGTVAQPGPLRLAIKYDRDGRKARDQIKAAGKTGALISSTVYNLLVSAVDGLTSTPAANFGASK
jgi:hypothetical protein